MYDRYSLEGVRRILIVVASCISLLFAWLIVRLLQTEIDITPIRNERSVSGVVRNDSRLLEYELPARTRQSVQDLLARPLFAPDRKPWRPPAKQPAQPRSSDLSPAIRQPEGLRLLGVLADPNRGPTALLVTADMPAGKWFRVDDVVGDWRVVLIDSDRVELAAGGARHKLTLYPASQSGGESVGVQVLKLSRP